jgi:uncharacterized protein (TIGR01777 family)
MGALSTLLNSGSKMSTNQPIILAGGTGFLGMNLARALVVQGRKVVILSRSKPDPGEWAWEQWDGKTQGEWSSIIDGARAIVNFSGISIDCFPSKENRKLILNSRVGPIHTLGKAVSNASQPPTAWIQLSAVGIYGNTTNQCTESTPPGEGFLPDTCVKWEAAFEQSCPESLRSITLRSGVVLGKNDGAFSMLRRLTRVGLGGSTGTGKQGMSWIHEDDMTKILIRVIDDESMNGTYNACAPNPASNRDFMRAIREAIGMPLGLPAPAFAVRLGARFILKTNPDLALEGQYAIPERIDQAGFGFKYPNLDDALNDLCKKE